jgi:hypothetical protein
MAKRSSSGVFLVLHLVHRLTDDEPIRTENQFVTYRVSVKDRLIAGPNELVITFPSTFLKARTRHLAPSFVRFPRVWLTEP